MFEFWFVEVHGFIFGDEGLKGDLLLFSFEV